MRRLVVAAWAVILALWGARVATAANPAVSVRDNAFEPKQITVAVGQTVVWTSDGSNPHSVTSDTGAFDSNPSCGASGTSGCLSRGQTFSFTFDRAGEFAYHCKIHGASGGVGMSGTVVVQAAGGKPVKRLAGGDRGGTAVAASQDNYPTSASAGAVVLSRSDQFADALAGTPLAKAKDGPLLLTPPGALDASARAEIKRVLRPGKTVYLLGGEAALSAAIATELSSSGYTVVRYGGANRAATAVQVASMGLGDPPTVLLATGLNFPDALSGGAAAAKAGGAVLLTNGAAMDPTTDAYLSSHPNDKVYALGGPAAAAEPSATPLVGNDRFDTSVKVADRFFSGPPAAGVANGLTFPDALSGGSHIAKKGGPMVLTSPTALPSVVRSYLAANKPSIAGGFLFGGPAAVSDSVRDQVQAAIS